MLNKISFIMLNKRLLHLIILFILSLAIGCKSYYYLKFSDKNVIAIDTNNVKTEDSSALKIIAPYKAQIDAQLNEVLAYSDEPMEKDLPEGKLNNFITDLILQVARKYYKADDGHNVDMCLLNSGGIRASLPKGAITKSKIFELMPFENQLVVVTLNGKQTYNMLEWIAENGGAPEAGLKLGIKNNKPFEIIINNKPFNENDNYKIVTSDYLAAGEDKYNFFKDPIKYEELGILTRDAIIEYLKEETKAGRTINAVLDKRIYYVK